MPDKVISNEVYGAIKDALYELNKLSGGGVITDYVMDRLRTILDTYEVDHNSFGVKK